MAAHGKHSKIGETMAKSVQRVARAGKGGDTRLAHVNPSEERMLKAAGGSGKINKRTGLKSFEKFDSSFAELKGSGEAGGASVRNTQPSGLKNVKKTSTAGISTGIARAETGQDVLFRAKAPTAPVATKAVPKPAAPAVAPAAAPVATATLKPTPIAQTLIGAINQSSGNTKSSLLNATAKKRATAAGTSSADLVSSVDQSRARSAAKGIVKPIDQSGL